MRKRSLAVERIPLDRLALARRILFLFAAIATVGAAASGCLLDDTARECSDCGDVGGG